MEGTGSFVCSSGARVLLATPSHAGSFVVLLRSYGMKVTVSDNSRDHRSDTRQGLGSNTQCSL